MPTTPTGWAGRLLLLALVCFAAFVALVAAGQRGGDTFFSNLWLTLPVLAASAAALAAGGCGGVAIARGERSVVAIVAVLIGAVIALWWAAELAFPH
jgi:hypothetical protein